MSRDAEVASAVQYACLLEASAPKPGNVSPGHAFRDMQYEDFLASAAAIGPAFLTVGRAPLGATVLDAVRATRSVVTTNTNLGIILLLAPLAKAAHLPGPDSWRTRTARVLADTTVADAALVYEAIRLITPGGLGTAPAEDVQAAPTITLREAMQLAAARDAVAREYADDFALTFTIGAPAIIAARTAGLGWADAVVECALTLLAHQHDTLIVRKLGETAAAEVQAEARGVLAAGGVRTHQGRAAVAAFDTRLRDPENRHNPGTTADLVAAACFVAIFGP